MTKNCYYTSNEYSGLIVPPFYSGWTDKTQATRFFGSYTKTSSPDLSISAVGTQSGTPVGNSYPQNRHLLGQFIFPSFSNLANLSRPFISFPSPHDVNDEWFRFIQGTAGNGNIIVSFQITAGDGIYTPNAGKSIFIPASHGAIFDKNGVLKWAASVEYGSGATSRIGNAILTFPFTGVSTLSQLYQNSKSPLGTDFLVIEVGIITDIGIVGNILPTLSDTSYIVTLKFGDSYSDYVKSGKTDPGNTGAVMLLPVGVGSGGWQLNEA